MNRFQQEVDAAVDVLLLQQVMLYPTDSGWQLGCDAEAPPAVRALYNLLGREAEIPATVLVADLTMLKRYATQVPAELEARLATDTQPTTYLLPASRAVARELMAPDGTIGLRLAKDEFCFKVLRRLGHGVVLAAASKVGTAAPAGYQDVDAGIVRGVDHVVGWRQNDDSRTAPSRVVRLGADGQLEVVRP